MTLVQKIDSNITGLRLAEEASIGVLPVAPIWVPQEPNSYSDFGGSITTVARNPINASRQRKKGVTTDLDASGGYNADLTQTNMQELLQGFFFANLRKKGEGVVASVDGTTEKYLVDHAAGFFVGSLAFADGHTDSTNDGLKHVTAVVSVKATGTLTLTGNANNNGTVTIGTTVYTFKTVLTGAAYEIFIGATASDSIDNLVAAVMGTPGMGTLYGIGTAVHPSITAVNGVGDTFVATAKLDGIGGNTIVTTELLTNATWGAGTLTGGDATVTVSENLVTEVPVVGAATLVVVGFQFAAGDLDVDATGALPKYTATAKDLTQLGIIPGEWFFVGDSSVLAPAADFNSAVNNGFKRARAVTATSITVDKSESTMVTEGSTVEAIAIFFGRVIKNELDTLIIRRTYQAERTLGAPDDANPTAVQAEYGTGGVANQFAINIPTADKVTVDLSFVFTDFEQRLSTQGLKAGTRPQIEEADAFNTSSDFKRIKLSKVIPGEEAPAPLFTFVQDLTLNIDNGANPNKAVSVLGAFEVTVGQFLVGGDITAYFADVAAQLALRENADMTLDVLIVKANSGIAMDLPLISLGDGRPAVAQNEAITLPLTNEAATGAKVDPNLNHTFLMVFFDYLPDDAEL